MKTLMEIQVVQLDNGQVQIVRKFETQYMANETNSWLGRVALYTILKAEIERQIAFEMVTQQDLIKKQN